MKTTKKKQTLKQLEKKVKNLYNFEWEFLQTYKRTNHIIKFSTIKKKIINFSMIEDIHFFKKATHELEEDIRCAYHQLRIIIQWGGESGGRKMETTVLEQQQINT